MDSSSSTNSLTLFRFTSTLASSARRSPPILQRVRHQNPPNPHRRPRLSPLTRTPFTRARRGGSVRWRSRLNSTPNRPPGKRENGAEKRPVPSTRPLPGRCGVTPLNLSSTSTSKRKPLVAHAQSAVVERCKGMTREGSRSSCSSPGRIYAVCAAGAERRGSGGADGSVWTKGVRSKRMCL